MTPTTFACPARPARYPPAARCGRLSTPIGLPTSASRAVLLLLLAADRQDQVDLSSLDQPLERVLSLAGRLADGVAEAELAALRHDHALQLVGELHQLVDVLGGLADERHLPRRRDLARACSPRASRSRAGRRSSWPRTDSMVAAQPSTLSLRGDRRRRRRRDNSPAGRASGPAAAPSSPAGRSCRSARRLAARSPAWPGAGPSPCAVIATRVKPRDLACLDRCPRPRRPSPAAARRPAGCG